LEQFAFCLEDSPYTKVMEAYFEEHGHRDPYTIGGEREEAQGINDEY
jgi:hypothetical protein